MGAERRLAPGELRAGQPGGRGRFPVLEVASQGRLALRIRSRLILCEMRSACRSAFRVGNLRFPSVWACVSLANPLTCGAFPRLRLHGECMREHLIALLYTSHVFPIWLRQMNECAMRPSNCSVECRFSGPSRFVCMLHRCAQALSCLL